MANLQFEYLGPYRVESLIGRGGMGTVYKGRHAKSGDLVAIKVITSGVANDVRFRRRFANEIETLKRLRHPNIVEMIGFGEEHSCLFLVMEYVDGHSLQDHLRQHKQLDAAETIQVGIEVCAALKHAHDYGIIHRDLKPANLLLTKEGHVKLADFGIVRMFDPMGRDSSRDSSDGDSSGHFRSTIDSPMKTGTGSLLGTVDFMAPEQAEGKAISVRTDIYSLGTVLYTLLVGRSPFEGLSIPEALFSLRYTPAPPLNRVVPETPGVLADLIHEMMEKDPLKRPTTAVVIANRLKALQDSINLRDRFVSAPRHAGSDRVPEISRELTSIDLTDADDVELRVTGEVDTKERPTVVASESMLSQIDLASQKTVCPNASPPAAPQAHASEYETIHPGDTLDKSLPSALSGPAKNKRSFYVEVDEEYSKRVAMGLPPETVESRFDWMQAISIAAMVGLLLGACAFGYWMLQPPSADALYSQINRILESSSESAITDAAEPIDLFLKTYPKDPRAQELEPWAKDAEVLKQARQLQYSLKLKGPTALSAVEHAYVDWHIARSEDPSVARNKLNALITVYGPQLDLSPRDRHLVDLAKHASKRMAESSDKGGISAAEQLAELIDKAQREMPKEQLQDYYRNLIELYGDKPWAREQLQRIR